MIVASGHRRLRLDPRRRDLSPASSSACSRSSRTTRAGQPLYAPYPLAVAVPAMAIEHLLFFGWVEALATMGVVAALAKQDSALLANKPAAKPLRWLWAALRRARAADPDRRARSGHRVGRVERRGAAGESGLRARGAREARRRVDGGDSRLRARVHQEPDARLPLRRGRRCRARHRRDVGHRASCSPGARRRPLRPRPAPAHDSRAAHISATRPRTAPPRRSLARRTALAVSTRSPRCSRTTRSRRAPASCSGSTRA